MSCCYFYVDSLLYLTTVHKNIEESGKVKG